MLGTSKHKAMLMIHERIAAPAQPAHVEDIPALAKNLFGRAVSD